MNKPTKKQLAELSKPFKDHPFDLLKRTNEALDGMKIGPSCQANYGTGSSSQTKGGCIIAEPRPKLIDTYIDPNDLDRPQLITLDNDIVYIVRTVQAKKVEWQVDPDSQMMELLTKTPNWRPEILFATFSTVCTPGNREIPDDYEDVYHYSGESELDALLMAIRVVLIGRYDGFCDWKMEQERVKDEKLAEEYFGGKR